MKSVVVLLKASGEGAISRGGKAHLDWDKRGHKHWRTDERPAPGRTKRAGTDRDSFTRLPIHKQVELADAHMGGHLGKQGVQVAEFTSEKGRSYVGFTGNTYAQLAQFRALKDARLVWGFKKDGRFIWACKPENLGKVMEGFDGFAADEQQPAGNAKEGVPKAATEAGSGAGEPRPDRRGDDRAGDEPERGGPRSVPGGAEAGSEGKDQDRGRAPEGGDGADAAGIIAGATLNEAQRDLIRESAKAGKWESIDGGVRYTPNDPKAFTAWADDGKPSLKKRLIRMLGGEMGAEVWESPNNPSITAYPSGKTPGAIVDQRGRTVQQGTSRPKPSTASKPETPGERPKEFKPRGPGVKPWEMSEDDYLAHAHEQAQKKAASNARGWQQNLDEMGPQKGKSRSRWGLGKRDIAESNVKYWTKRAAELDAQEKPTDVEADSARKDYAEIVRKAISKGEPVPSAVIGQRPEFKKAETARARFEKGHHTSFANESIAVDRSQKAARGIKVKRQDGKPIKPEQLAEILKGIDEVEEVLGPLKDLFDKTDVTIAHTSGKHPFLSDAGGMYHGSERTVTAGINDRLGRPIAALAHELGHWLDMEAGRALGHNTRVMRGKRYGDSTSLADHEHRGYDNRLLSEATRRMSDTWEVRRILKKKYGDAADPEEQVEIERAKVVLGPYWREPREVFARLFEQYITTERGAGGVASRTTYHGKPGWWSKDDFEHLKPMVREAVAQRIKALGGDPSKMKGSDPMAKGGMLDWLLRRFRRQRPLAKASSAPPREIHRSVVLIGRPRRVSSTKSLAQQQYERSHPR